MFVAIVFFTVETSLSVFSLPGFLCAFSHVLHSVSVKDFVLVQISQFTDTVINNICSFLRLDDASSFGCFGLLSIIGLELGLFFLDVIHELLDVLDWIEVLGLVLFA